MLKNVNFPWPIAAPVLEHHERLDGSGYPNGLKGDQISVEGRILTVADVVDAMSSHRPYRAALAPESTLVEIKRERGTLYDATVVDAVTAIGFMDFPVMACWPGFIGFSVWQLLQAAIFSLTAFF